MNDDIVGYCLEFINDDYTELWLIANKVQDENPHLNLDNHIKLVKEIIKKLVDEYNVTLLDEKSQQSLHLKTDDILKIVEEKYRIINRIPNIGDGVWFTLSDPAPVAQSLPRSAKSPDFEPKKNIN